MFSFYYYYLFYYKKLNVTNIWRPFLRFFFALSGVVALQ
jgi:hypothetical protein